MRKIIPICFLFVFLTTYGFYKLSIASSILISNSEIMNISLNNNESIVIKQCVNSLKKIPFGIFDSYFYICEIDKKNSIRFDIYKNTIYMMRTEGQLFKTDRGVKIGDSFSKVLKKYPEGQGEYSGEEGGYLTIRIPSENITFSFEFENMVKIIDAGKLTDAQIENQKLKTIIIHEPLEGPVF